MPRWRIATWRAPSPACARRKSGRMLEYKDYSMQKLVSFDTLEREVRARSLVPPAGAPSLASTRLRHARLARQIQKIIKMNAEDIDREKAKLPPPEP